MVKISFGDYPAAYKPEVHGPYDPARYYGKPDTPFEDVKLGELTAWIKRRNHSFRSYMGALSRFHWRTCHKYFFTKKYSLVYYMQVVSCCQLIYFVANNYKNAAHVRAKYH